MEVRSIRNKKSAIEDIFFVLVVLVGFALFFLILANVASTIYPRIGTQLNNAGDTSIFNATSVMDEAEGTTNQYNHLFPFIFIGLLGFALFAGGFVSDSPIMIFIGVLVVGVAVILGVVYSNVYHEISQTDQFASTTANFPVMDLFMQYLPLFIFATAAIVVIFVLIRKGGGGSGI